MGLETVGVALSIASGIMGVVQGVSQMSAANAAYAVTNTAVQENVQAQYRELDRQQREVVEQASDQRSDRIAQATRELSTLRVLAGEMGTSTGTFMGLVREVGYFEGVDLSRINQSAQSNIDRAQAEKDAVRRGGVNTITTAGAQRDASRTGGLLTAIGSGLRIGTDLYGGYERRRANEGYLNTLEKVSSGRNIRTR